MTGSEDTGENFSTLYYQRPSNPFQVLDELRWLAHWPLSEVKVLFLRYKQIINPLLAPNLYVIYLEDFVELFNLHGRRPLVPASVAQRIGEVFAFEVGNEEEDDELAEYYQHQRQGKSSLEYRELKEKHEQYVGGKAGGGKYVIDIFEAISGLAVFCESENFTALEEKIRFIFSLFDFNETLDLTYDEVVLMLSSIVRAISRFGGVILPPSNEQLELVVGNMFSSIANKSDESDEEKDDVTLDEFVDWVRESPVAEACLNIIESVYAYENLVQTIHDQIATIEDIQSYMRDSLNSLPFPIEDRTSEWIQIDEIRAKTAINLIGVNSNKSLRMDNTNMFNHNGKIYSESPLSPALQIDHYKMVSSCSGTRILFGPMVGKVTEKSCESIVLKINRDAEIICHLAVLGASAFQVNFCGRNVRDTYSHGSKPSNIQVIRSFPVTLQANILKSFRISSLRPCCEYMIFFSNVNSIDSQTCRAQFSTLKVASAQVNVTDQYLEIGSETQEAFGDEDSIVSIHICAQKTLKESYLSSVMKKSNSSNLIVGDFEWDFEFSSISDKKERRQQHQTWSNILNDTFRIDKNTGFYAVALRNGHLLVVIEDIGNYLGFKDAFLNRIEQDESVSKLTIAMKGMILGTPKFTWLCRDILRPEDAWVSAIDETSKKQYWWNTVTKETTAVGAPKPTTGFLSNIKPEDAWLPVTDDASQKTYWWNTVTKETTEVGAAKPTVAYLKSGSKSTEDSEVEVDELLVECRMAALRKWHSTRKFRKDDAKNRRSSSLAFSKSLGKKAVPEFLHDLFNWLNPSDSHAESLDKREVTILSSDQNETIEGIHGSGRIYKPDANLGGHVNLEILSCENEYSFQHPKNTFYKGRALPSEATACGSFVLRTDISSHLRVKSTWNSDEKRAGKVGSNVELLPMLVFGPIIGKVTINSALIMLRTDKDSVIKCCLKIANDSRIVCMKEIKTISSKITEIHFTDLKPNTAYVYYIHGVLHATNDYRLVSGFRTAKTSNKNHDVILCFMNHQNVNSVDGDAHAAINYTQDYEKNEQLTSIVHLGRCYKEAVFENKNFENMISSVSSIVTPPSLASKEYAEQQYFTKCFNNMTHQAQYHSHNSILQCWQGNTAIMYVDLLGDKSWKYKASQGINDIEKCKCKSVHIILDGLALPVVVRQLPKEFEQLCQTKNLSSKDFYCNRGSRPDSESQKQEYWNSLEYEDQCQQLMELILTWKINRDLKGLEECEVIVVSPSKSALLSWTSEIFEVESGKKIFRELIIPPLMSNSSSLYPSTEPVPNIEVEDGLEASNSLSDSDSDSWSSQGSESIQFVRRNVKRNVKKIGLGISKSSTEKLKNHSYILSYPIFDTGGPPSNAFAGSKISSGSIKKDNANEGVKTDEQAILNNETGENTIKKISKQSQQDNDSNRERVSIFDKKSLDCTCMQDVVDFVYTKYLKTIYEKVNEKSEEFSDTKRKELEVLESKLYELTESLQTEIDGACELDEERTRLFEQQRQEEKSLLQDEKHRADVILEKQNEQEMQWRRRWRTLSHLRTARSKLTGVVDLCNEGADLLTEYFKEIAAIKARVPPKELRDAVKEYTENCECAKKLLKVAELSEEAKKLLTEKANVLSFEGNIRVKDNHEFDFSAELAGNALKKISKMFQKQVTASVTVEEQTGLQFVHVLAESFKLFNPQKKKMDESIARRKKKIKKLKQSIIQCDTRILECKKKTNIYTKEIHENLINLRSKSRPKRELHQLVNHWRMYALPFSVSVLASFLPVRQDGLQGGCVSSKCLDEPGWLTKLLHDESGEHNLDKVMSLREFIEFTRNL